MHYTINTRTSDSISSFALGKLEQLDRAVADYEKTDQQQQDQDR